MNWETVHSFSPPGSSVGVFGAAFSALVQVSAGSVGLGRIVGAAGRLIAVTSGILLVIAGILMIRDFFKNVVVRADASLVVNESIEQSQLPHKYEFLEPL